MTALAQKVLVYRRWICAIGGAVVTVVAIMAAGQLTGDLALAGLNDAQVRGIGHFMAYGTLAAMLAVAMGFRFTLANAAAAGIAAVDELHQWFVPGRWASVTDWLIDVTAIAMALGVIALLRARVARREVVEG